MLLLLKVKSLIVRELKARKLKVRIHNFWDFVVASLLITEHESARYWIFEGIDDGDKMLKMLAAKKKK